MADIQSLDLRALSGAVSTTLSPAAATQAAVGDISPKKKKGKPVQTSVASMYGGVLQPQYAALKDEAAADHPILELSPEVQKMMAKAGEVISDQLSGVISPDVEAQVQRITAETAGRFGLGIASQAARNLTARDLGRTSADLQQQGVANATALAELDVNWQSQRLKFLSSAQALDLSGAELKQKQYQFDLAHSARRLTLLSNTVSNYYKLAFGYESTKNASQANLVDMKTNIQTVVSRMLADAGGGGRGK